MVTNMVETYLLEQFIAFCREGSLSKASQTLHITQPTMTRSMKKLEEQFGVPLFEHKNKRLILNENGQLAVSFAENILRENEQMLRQVRALHRSRQTISLGSCAPGPVMEYVPKISGIYPEKTISSEVRSDEELIAGLYNKTYQLVVLDHTVRASDLFCRKCGSETLYLSVPPDHPKAGSSEVIFAEMNGETFLMASEVGIWGDIVKTYMPDSKFLLQSDLDALAELAKASSIASFATDITLAVLGNRGDRIPILFADDAATVDYYCVCLNEEKHEYLRWFQSLAV